WKARVEFSAVMRSAACQACDRSAYPADARKFLSAIWAPINKARCMSSCRKREIMTALFISDSKIATCLLPLGAMREKPSPSHAKLGEKMGQFMTQSAIDFRRMLKQPGI